MTNALRAFPKASITQCTFQKSFQSAPYSPIPFDFRKYLSWPRTATLTLDGGARPALHPPADPPPSAAYFVGRTATSIPHYENLPNTRTTEAPEVRKRHFCTLHSQDNPQKLRPVACCSQATISCGQLPPNRSRKLYRTHGST
ncbi:hypothetical protein VTL71DRAFT_769 [Oculimacula yallundae]|uniref:Uncharacterized protein n=1 Tax=Oculimacula yallundae TaxID=86028 RepID=A0ABR4D3A0_9HELO